MATAKINGINIHYETYGSGPALLMAAPGGFSALGSNWATTSIWKGMRALEAFSQHYTCITFDRREAGQSGGRVERLSWALYAQEGRGLLDHLGIEKAFVIGGCMGCSVAAVFGFDFPERTLGLILAQPAGGAQWHITMRNKFADHMAYVAKNGLAGVVKLSRESKQAFQTDGNVGPWANSIQNDEAFARAFAAQDQDRYLAIVRHIAGNMYDRDTFPGLEPDEAKAIKIPALIIQDDTMHHAPSASRYLHECMPHALYPDVPPARQTPEMVRDWITAFMAAHR